ncbi:lysosomal-associated transmembrane protein 4A [Galendromus occidentalis]|uniref:Lysosomal-associated transmembrane protein 4A n=1 Tax=Galendromus occidentalis TaxID=34638 RepID=A0AAJ6QYU2_9ACAR|nr:lysosomal-associated transmembrane protein 4A [Galendromus occidentalis]
MEAGRNSRIKTHHDLLHSRDFQCCCCVHVRTGTIASGLFHVMMQMAAVAILATAILNPDALIPPKTAVVQTSMDLDQNYMEIHRDTIIEISKVVMAPKKNLVSSLLLNILFGFIAMLVVYGAFWGQPPYILPFFAYLCFDFAIAMLDLIGSFAEHHTSPHSREPPLHGFHLMMAVIFKAYLLNMVWSCYKYLRLRQELLRNPPVAISNQPTMAHRPATMEASQLLPDYEATQKYPYNFYTAPPPPYQMATQMPTIDQVQAPPPSYDDVAGTSRQVDLPPETEVLEGAVGGAVGGPVDVQGCGQPSYSAVRTDGSSGPREPHPASESAAQSSDRSRED